MAAKTSEEKIEYLRDFEVTIKKNGLVILSGMLWDYPEIFQATFNFVNRIERIANNDRPGHGFDNKSD